MYRLTLILLFAFTLSTHAQLVPKDAVPEKVADGYKFTEGPALGPDGCIYFTDIPASLILKFDPETKETTTFIKNSEKTNGLMWHDGKLYACSHGARAVRYYNLNPKERDKARSPQAIRDGLLAGKPDDAMQPQIVSESIVVSINHEEKPIALEFKKFNSPNDLAIDQSGNIYFTDPRYGNRDNMELDFEGVYYHAIDGQNEQGQVIFESISNCFDADLTRPNGIILSPDESILYVADNGANYIYAYDIESPGKVKNKRVFGRINDGKGGGSDGMTVDHQGRLYATGHSKVWVFEPTGQLVATIPVGKQTTNCTFGADGETLYITANKGLYRITLNTDAPLEHAEKK